MRNLETNETRARYKEQEQRILMRSELSDEEKDDAIDSLFDRYCADYNCWGSNIRTQLRFSESNRGIFVDIKNGLIFLIIMFVAFFVFNMFN